MLARNVSAAIGVAILSIFGMAAPATAQGVGSPGCNAINGGAFNQDADLTGGLPIILAFDFNAGETITATITNATDSLAFIDVNDLFDGDVGSQSRSVTLGAPGTFNVGTIIDGPGATIRLSCAVGGGGGQGELGEVENTETTAQSVEDNVRLTVVPAALVSTFGSGDLLQVLEQQRVEQAIENRIRVRQGIEDLRKRGADDAAAAEQEKTRVRNDLTGVVRERRSAEIEAFGNGVATILRENGDLSEFEISEIVTELEDGIVRGIAGVFRELDVREEKRKTKASIPLSATTPDDDDDVEFAFQFAQVLTGFDAETTSRDAINVNVGNVLRIGFINTVIETFEGSGFGKSLRPSAQAAVRRAINELEPLEENFKPNSGGLFIPSLQANRITLTADRNSDDSDLADIAEEAINSGDFGRAAGILERNNIDIGSAGSPDADFDTNVRGGADLGLNDGEQILFSARNGRTLDFSFDSDILKQIAALSHGGEGTVTGPSDTKIWIKGRVALLDGDRDGADGETAEVLIGAVQRLSRDLEVGTFAGFFTSDLTTNAVATDIETDAFKLGLYGNYLTATGLRLGLSGAVDFGDTNTNRGGVTAQFNYRNYDLSGSIAGATLVENWVVSPSFSGTLSHRYSDKHTDSGGLFVGSRSDTDIIATASVSASRTFLVEGDMLRAVSPNVVATGNYFFFGNDGQDDFDHLALSLGGGATFAFQNGSHLALTTGIGGFGQDTMSYSGQLRFTLPF